jgi:GrpB-like predicted nucleotidyltransferase (UPF0157 family)
MPFLFSYGTLQEPDIQLSTFGRLLDGHKDELPGFERVAVRIDDAQVIAATGRADHASVRSTRTGDSRVSGTVFEITEAELALADRYEELAAYKRISATLASGKEAWVYVDGRRAVVVVDYDPAWAQDFERVRAKVWPAVSDLASSIEHVGSTSVPGLSAKPILDISIVVPSSSDVAAGIARVATLGYVHQGNLGVEGREAFSSIDGLPRHNLYLCPADGLGLVNQLTFRDYLRRHPEAANEYAELKRALAKRFPYDVESYAAAKTEFVVGILRSAGFPRAKLDAITAANRIS